jgi:hypothetical protein
MRHRSDSDSYWVYTRHAQSFGLTPVVDPKRKSHASAHSLTASALTSTVFGTVCHRYSKPRRDFVEPRGYDVQDRGLDRLIQSAQKETARR